jgi:F-type H+-transporting ATPase subunit b
MASTASKTGTEAHGGPKGAFPPFDKEQFGSQLFWLAIAFVALYVLLAFVVLPRIAGIFTARRRRVESDVEIAGKLRVESEAAIEAYEKALADARAKAQAIAAATRDALNAAAQDKKKSLEAALAARLAEAERQIAATKAAAMAHVRTIAVETAATIVQELVGEAPSRQTLERAVEASLH